jgi:hypothetical protein
VRDLALKAFLAHLDDNTVDKDFIGFEEIVEQELNEEDDSEGIT